MEADEREVSDRVVDMAAMAEVRSVEAASVPECRRWRVGGWARCDVVEDDGGKGEDLVAAGFRVGVVDADGPSRRLLVLIAIP